MRFSFTDEQEQFRDVVRRFVRDKSPSTEVRRMMDSTEGFDPNVWRQLCEELALAGLHIPEAYGGIGLGHVDLAVLLEATGEALLCSPLFSATLRYVCSAVPSQP